ncbi:MAG: hypothetical protein RIR00_2361 [Pseudomonadota bacterium]|jgi:hypothetical protein
MNPRQSHRRLMVLGSLLLGTAAQAAFIDQGNGTVIDLDSGLTWQRCAVGQTCQGQAGSFNWAEAAALSGQVDFAGTSDWRLPTIRELATLARPRSPKPSLDNQAFPATPASTFWSATQLSFDDWLAWQVDFNDGSVLLNARILTQPPTLAHARLVRGGEGHARQLNLSRPAADFLDHGNGSVTHLTSGLMWQRCPLGQNWDGQTCSGTASSFADTQLAGISSSLGGHSDWRLPEIDELLSLQDFTGLNNRNPDLFPGCNICEFWSATPDINHPSSRWIHANWGDYMLGSQDSRLQVRLVRAPRASRPTPLAPGWNLLGNSSSQTLNVSTLFNDAQSFRAVWKWLPAAGNWAFHAPGQADGGAAYAASRGLQTLQQIGPGEGFWVQTERPVAISLGSDTPLPSSHFQDGKASNGGNLLGNGWNLIAVGDAPSPRQFVNTIAATPPSPGTPAAPSLSSLWAWHPGNLQTPAGWLFYAPQLDNNGTLDSYVDSKGYHDFTRLNRKLDLSDGFWVNR